MNIDWNSKVLSSLNPVIENLQTINLNLDQIMNVADWIAYEDFPPPEQNISKNNPDEFIRTTMLINTLNFAFTDFENSTKYEIIREGKVLSDSEAMFVQIQEAISSGVQLYNGNVLSDLDDKQLKNIFKGNIEMPMMSERLDILLNVGAKLSDDYEGDWMNFINAGPKKLYDNGEGLIERLTSEFPRFDDTSEYAEKYNVHFYKLAQLAFWGIHAELAGTGDFYIEDMQSMSAFADYIVPVALEVMKIVEYSEELRNKITNGEIIGRDSLEEIEIRSTSLYITAKLTEEINKRRPVEKSIIIPQLDYRLWKQYHATHRPHHLTITTMY
ncbi:queuosine salvage family protein [Candidatus Actinomarina]|nr:queuosine salvage family protein [Candidatus Actinomarina sp.]